MLYIHDQNGLSHRTITWRIGEPLPEIKSRVVIFQADGDELQVILEALKKTRK